MINTEGKYVLKSHLGKMGRVIDWKSEVRTRLMFLIFIAMGNFIHYSSNAQHNIIDSL